MPYRDDLLATFSVLYRPKLWWFEVYGMARRLTLTCAVLLCSDLSTTIIFVRTGGGVCVCEVGLGWVLMQSRARIGATSRPHDLTSLPQVICIANIALVIEQETKP